MHEVLILIGGLLVVAGVLAVVLGSVLAPIVMTILKGKGVNVFFILIPFVGYPIVVWHAIRLAAPYSWWARHVYGDAKFDRALARA